MQAICYEQAGNYFTQTRDFSFEAERKTCELLEMGVAAVFGPQNLATADHIRSITDVAEIPFIDTRYKQHSNEDNIMSLKWLICSYYVPHFYISISYSSVVPVKTP